MCLLCKEVVLEKITPKDFWRNYKEVSDEHKEEVIDKVSKTSSDYQTKLANEFLKNS